MIPSASAFNSCMTEFSIPDFNETIIKNIISLFIIFLNTERREVVFRPQWFIGQYCSERTRREFRCRCTSAPLSLYTERRIPECIAQNVLIVGFLVVKSIDIIVSYILVHPRVSSESVIPAIGVGTRRIRVTCLDESGERRNGSSAGRSGEHLTGSGYSTNESGPHRLLQANVKS